MSNNATRRGGHRRRVLALVDDAGLARQDRQAADLILGRAADVRRENDVGRREQRVALRQGLKKVEFVDGRVAGNLTTDAHIAAIAIEHQRLCHANRAWHCYGNGPNNRNLI